MIKDIGFDGETKKYGGDTYFSSFRFMGDTVHECTVKMVGRAKIWAIIDDHEEEEQQKAYLIQDREVYVTFGSNNLGKWVPTVLLTYGVSDNKETWLNYLPPGVRKAAIEEPRKG